jgi:hypothetical protein
MMDYGIGAAIGWLVGCFTPGICRKVKSWFVDSKAVVTDVKTKL